MNDEVEANGQVKLVKVYAESTWDAVCRMCKRRVMWGRTVTHNKWVLFDGDVQSAKERNDARDGALTYFPVEKIHWKHCHAGHSREQPGQSAGSGGAGS